MRLGRSITPIASSRRDITGLVVGGKAGVQAAFRAQVSAPILPVDGPVGLEPIDRTAVADAITAIVEGRATRVLRTVLQGTRGDNRSLRGLFDATILTTDPAAISEFELVVGDRGMGRLRADGIAVTTAAGSGGYGAAAGGPILDPSAGVVAVVPVSPFMTQDHVWVLQETPIRIRVTRDENTVGVYVDDRAAGRLHAGEEVTLTHEDAFETFRVPQSISPYRRESA